MAMLAILPLALGAASAFGAGAGPADPPAGYRQPVLITQPSVVAGQPASIEVGGYPPDFQLQPVQPYADFKNWLGEEAPESFEQTVMLSKFVGKAPVMLLFGSYT